MKHIVILAAVTSCVIVSAANAQQNCTPIKFAHDTSSATVKGVASSHDDGKEGVCFTLATGRGQTATLKLIPFGPKDDIAFTVPGVVDDHDSYNFKTEAKTYTISVFRTFTREPDEPFTHEGQNPGRIWDKAGSIRAWTAKSRGIQRAPLRDRVNAASACPEFCPSYQNKPV
jgi:hypothetical protein